MAKLCPKGKAAAKRKFKVYPSAYANMYASKVCKGKVRASAKDGGKIEKIPGGYFKKGLGAVTDKGLSGKNMTAGEFYSKKEKRMPARKTIGAKRKRTQMREGGMVIENMTKMIEI